jgi:Glycosyl transferase family 2
LNGTIGVVVATFGDRGVWGPLALRAIESLERQTVPVDAFTWEHRTSLREGRNHGARRLATDWLIFLDADDELDSHYIEAMRAVERGDVLVPLTFGIYEDGSEDPEPVRIGPCDLRYSNYAVIGTMHRHHLFDEVGGFGDFPCLEDWALWRSIARTGAEFVLSEAVYRVHVRSGSRNSDHSAHARAYTRILREVPL